MNYRLADHPDIPELAKLLGLLFEQEEEFFPSLEQQMQGLKMILENPEEGVIFVATRDNQVLAMINILFTVSTALGARVAVLEDMIVSADSRGKGIGSGLIEHAIEYCRGCGIKRISLLTDPGNVSAHAFYGRHGFQPSNMVVFRRMLE